MRSSFVVVAVILNMLSFGIIMPVMPALLEDITGLGAAQSVVYGGWLSMTFAIANFLAMPILGGLSDRYGRRPVLLASIGMLGIDLLIMGLAPTLARCSSLGAFSADCSRAPIPLPMPILPTSPNRKIAAERSA